MAQAERHFSAADMTVTHLTSIPLPQIVKGILTVTVLINLKALDDIPGKRISIEEFHQTGPRARL